MKIAIGSDHGGLKLKELIIHDLMKNGYEVKDFGTYTNESCDYPDYAASVANAVASKQYSRGIVICGTGIGVSICANKFKGIRCSLCHDVFSAKATREHNDANVLALGQRVIGNGLALEILHTWLKTEYTGGRHERRLKKIQKIEEGEINVRSNC